MFKLCSQSLTDKMVSPPELLFSCEGLCVKRPEDIVFEISLIVRDTKSYSAVKSRTILDFVRNH